MLWLAFTAESLQNSSDSLNNVFYTTFSRELSIAVLVNRSSNNLLQRQIAAGHVHNEKMQLNLLELE